MKYNTDVSYEPRVNEEYNIISVDEVTTRNGLQGVRVELTSKNTLDKRSYGVTLWPSSQVSATSKWGAFIVTLGNDTDKWIGKHIRIFSLESRKCEIAIVRDNIKDSSLDDSVECPY